MNNLAFDTLQYANKLKAAGVPEKQAEVQAETMAEFIVGNLATKDESLSRWVASKEDLANVKEELKGDIAELRVELKGDMKDMELRLQKSLNRFLFGISVIAAGAPAATWAIMQLLRR